MNRQHECKISEYNKPFPPNVLKDMRSQLPKDCQRAMYARGRLSKAAHLYLAVREGGRSGKTSDIICGFALLQQHKLNKKGNKLRYSYMYVDVLCSSNYPDVEGDLLFYAEEKARRESLGHIRLKALPQDISYYAYKGYTHNTVQCVGRKETTVGNATDGYRMSKCLHGARMVTA